MMDELEKMDNDLSSAAAFVKGGIQDSCDDACSICLEAFCDSDPSIVTTCKHEYHLQCILEWCQRSSQCPMCWRSISLKNPTSQELFDAVDKERNIILNRTRSADNIHHPTLPNAVLQERTIGHLAATAATGRTYHMTRREGQLDRSESHGRQQFWVLSPHQNAPNFDSVSASSAQREDSESTSIFAASQSTPLPLGSESLNQEAHYIPVQTIRSPRLTSGINSTASRATVSANRIPAGQTTPVGQDKAGLSGFQSFSENLKSRLNAVSLRYKESITKNTQGWRERIFSRHSSVVDIGSEARKEFSAGIANVSRMMERLDTRERIFDTSGSSNTEVQSAVRPSWEGVSGNRGGHSNDGSTSTSYRATSGPS